MIIKVGKYEFGDITFIVDDDDEYHKGFSDPLSALCEAIPSGVATYSFRNHEDGLDFINDNGDTPVSAVLYIENPEIAIRPSEAKAFVMRVGNLAAQGKRIVVLTRDYFILAYAAVIHEYKSHFWPATTTEWRFLYYDAKTGEFFVGGDGIDDPMVCHDSIIGAEMDRVYDFEASLIYGD